MALTDLKIRQAKPGKTSSKLTDSGGLYLEVTTGGSKLWRYRFRLAGKENTYAIGSYPDVSLSDARTERDVARDLVKSGRNPAHVRQTEKAQQLTENRNTFKIVAQEWIEKRLVQRTQKYRDQIERAFVNDVYPRIGRLPLREITAAQVLEIITAMDRRDATTLALMVRQWISAVFCYGVATLRADSDPAAAVRGAIRRNEVNHSRPMSLVELREYFKAVKNYGGHRRTVIALYLLPILFVRTVELRLAEWSEFDLDAALWTIPAQRMKKRKIHVVPLPESALVLLRELREMTAGDLLFPGMRHPKEPISATTLNRALEYMDLKGWHCHDFRATASTHLYESELWSSDVIEFQLAHVEQKKSKAAYNHALYLPARKSLMQWWDNYIFASETNG
ncbi:tyrosine-type recombinase/integrase [Pseudomonas syringae]|uniref:tyrosine-type recombinase/integrase n=1 Tax=Pseudomonas syringae TaxID=317 RepID=UPI0002099AA4|nr:MULTISPECIES: integrase arm-type DNA-binding domain-containing protein [Pseudomonas syringae group]EGH97643.1 prophage PSPPH01, site-specific recombinase phage integrase family protein [Pseudomonas amygdali pv. lachrymans str. M302278]KPC11489.1 Prophage PSPPH01 [Pseudomonas amygdali pv. lachrymans]RMM16885.1 Prophage PSPPH01, site-specific recombinase phage integrase protein [Pseudomonas syringae]